MSLNIWFRDDIRNNLLADIQLLIGAGLSPTELRGALLLARAQATRYGLGVEAEGYARIEAEARSAIERSRDIFPSV